MSHQSEVLQVADSDKRSTNLLLVMLCHLGYFSGVGFFLAPVIIWLLKKGENPWVARHAKQAWVYQGVVCIFTTLFALGGFIFTFITAGLGMLVFFPAIFLLTLATLIPSLQAAYQAYLGNEFDYPITSSWSEKF